jgi:hypothetical protein
VPYEQRLAPQNYKEINKVKLLKLVRNLILISSLVVGTLAWSQTSETFRGEATVAQATVLGIEATVGSTGALPKNGGALQSTLATVNIPEVLSAVAAQSEVIGVGDHTDASTTLTNLNLLSSGIGITADLVQSRAYAKGSSSQAPITSGSSQIVNLSINGTPIIATGAPNQVIKLGVGTVTLNEITPGVGSITVIAIHIAVPAVLDVQLGKSYAGVGPCTGCSYGCSGTPNCSGNFDFLFGGGALLDNVKVNAYFAVALGLNNGKNWGNLIYNDPDGGISLVGTNVIQYTVKSSVERLIQGNAVLNGATAVTYTLDVVQTGSQTFNVTLTLSTGYSVTGSIDLGFLEIRQACN